MIGKLVLLIFRATRLIALYFMDIFFSSIFLVWQGSQAKRIECRKALPAGTFSATKRKNGILLSPS